ncbi:MAG: hypothetical protein QM760_16330 [Nibricoccus sp.]
MLDRSFKTPAGQDLVVVEAHVRDLVANAPIKLRPEERFGFAGLRQWVESPEFYLHNLGVNCVELQPIQEADNCSREDDPVGLHDDELTLPRRVRLPSIRRRRPA